MNLVLMTDNYMSDMVETLAPHKNFFDMNNPRSITSVASIPKPVASTIISWLSGKNRRVNPTNEQIAFMQSVAI